MRSSIGRRSTRPMDCSGPDPERPPETRREARSVVTGDTDAGESHAAASSVAQAGCGTVDRNRTAPECDCGATVAIEIEDLYESRRVLESMLAGVGTERIAERGLNQLSRILDMQETAVSRGTLTGSQISIESSISCCIVRPAMRRAFTSRRRCGTPVSDTSASTPSTKVECGFARRPSTILQLCIDRDVQGVRDEVERHIVHGMETLRHAAGELNAPAGRTESIPGRSTATMNQRPTPNRIETLHSLNGSPLSASR